MSGSPKRLKYTGCNVGSYSAGPDCLLLIIILENNVFTDSSEFIFLEAKNE
jgi:hypothetical protein